ncbi:fumarylacetoacetate hydrolase family protein [Anaeromyxobacter oryzae]|uniref:2-hydroxyhepta-2,4-diene-1,7-dioate isomerase n=1 Tax=Anaeromyxobacter oryzae TaxID=2918170 RepID=A0ABN6MUJ4_9BACT|nr:fumarylacetoacetate hydrolase family protein [Anaeromyxobacter oryzae]BDG03940.1 2-hydroxyhepta-2,4-diene-1,7-dioate isomerase [Anaeromyxobacter oryzae]
MRICRFRRSGVERYGAIEGTSVRPLSAAPWAGGLADGAPVPLAEVTLLAPVEPTKVVCVGRNYVAHAKELGNEVPKIPLIFLKPSTSVVGPQDAIRCPEQSREVHHEGELGVVLGRTLTRATAAEAREAVFGYTCLNDVTARDIQREEKQFTRAKGFDTFCPVGPVVETAFDPLDASVVCRVNGDERQRGYTRDMAFDVYALLAFISGVMTLLPGDVVATGTPEGVGPIRRGDWVEVEVPGIGVLRNPVT